MRIKNKKGGGIRVDVQGNSILIKNFGEIPWEKMIKRYHDLVTNKLLYVPNKSDGSIDELAHKDFVGEESIKSGKYRLATSDEINRLYSTEEGKDILFFDHRGISFAEDKVTDDRSNSLDQVNSGIGSFMARVYSKKYQGTVRVLDDGEISKEVSIGIEFSDESPFIFIGRAMMQPGAQKPRDIPSDFITRLSSVLEQDFPTDEPNRGVQRNAGVVLLLRQIDGKWEFLLTKRARSLSSWPGAWVLPGGNQDHPESIRDAALRELKEEMGPSSEVYDVIGVLRHEDTLDKKSYRIYPYVAAVRQGKDIEFNPNKKEVEDYAWIPVDQLLTLSDKGALLNTPLFSKEEFPVQRGPETITITPANSKILFYFANAVQKVIKNSAQLAGLKDQAMLKADRDGFNFAREDRFAIEKEQNSPNFTVRIKGESFYVTPVDDWDGRETLNFSYAPFRSYNNYIYTKPIRHGGPMAIRGVFVDDLKDMRVRGMMNLMIRVLLQQHPGVVYVHPEARNALLLRELMLHFGFKPEDRSAKPNAYYLDGKVFIGMSDRGLIDRTSSGVDDQYSFTHDLNAISVKPGAMGIYLGQTLIRDNSTPLAGEQQASRAMTNDPKMLGYLKRLAYHDWKFRRGGGDLLLKYLGDHDFDTWSSGLISNFIEPEETDEVQRYYVKNLIPGKPDIEPAVKDARVASIFTLGKGLNPNKIGEDKKELFQDGMIQRVENETELWLASNPKGAIKSGTDEEIELIKSYQLSHGKLPEKFSQFAFLENIRLIYLTRQMIIQKKVDFRGADTWVYAQINNVVPINKLSERAKAIIYPGYYDMGHEFVIEGNSGQEKLVTSQNRDGAQVADRAMKVRIKDIRPIYHPAGSRISGPKSINRMIEASLRAAVFNLWTKHVPTHSTSANGTGIVQSSELFHDGRMYGELSLQFSKLSKRNKEIALGIVPGSIPDQRIGGPWQWNSGMREYTHDTLEQVRESSDGNIKAVITTNKHSRYITFYIPTGPDMPVKEFGQRALMIAKEFKEQEDPQTYYTFVEKMFEGQENEADLMVLFFGRSQWYRDWRHFLLRSFGHYYDAENDWFYPSQAAYSKALKIRSRLSKKDQAMKSAGDNSRSAIIERAEIRFKKEIEILDLQSQRGEQITYNQFMDLLAENGYSGLKQRELRNDMAKYKRLNGHSHPMLINERERTTSSDEFVKEDKMWHDFVKSVSARKEKTWKQSELPEIAKRYPEKAASFLKNNNILLINDQAKEPKKDVGIKSDKIDSAQVAVAPSKPGDRAMQTKPAGEEQLKVSVEDILWSIINKDRFFLGGTEVFGREMSGFFIPLMRTRAARQGLSLNDYSLFLQQSTEQALRERGRWVTWIEKSLRMKAGSDLTDFFRFADLYEDQLSDFLDNVLKEKWSNGNKYIRVRHIGTAGGEEIFTGMIYMYQALQRLYNSLNIADQISFEEWSKDWRIDIDGFDGQAENLSKIKRGIYSGKELEIDLRNYFSRRGEIASKDRTHHFLEKYFDKVIFSVFQVNSYYKVKDEITRHFHVHPIYLNLEEASHLDVLDQNHYDLTFCQNTLMYLNLGAEKNLMRIVRHSQNKDHFFIHEGMLVRTKDDKTDYFELSKYFKENLIAPVKSLDYGWVSEILGADPLKVIEEGKVTINPNRAMLGFNKGGIDLTPAKMNVETRAGSPTEAFRDDKGRSAFGNDNGIQFHLDPAMLAQLQNASGFVPVIISVEPLVDLRAFLGVQ